MLEFQPTTGFVNMKLEDETPMFTKQKVNFAPTNQITHLVVGGNTIVLAMAKNVLLRINLSAPDVLEGKYPNFSVICLKRLGRGFDSLFLFLISLKISSV